MPYGMDGKAIPPYIDAQMQLENRDLKAQMAHATRLLEEAQALARVEQQTAYRMSERVTALATQNATLLRALEDVLNMYPDCPPALAALADPSPLAEAMQAVVDEAASLPNVMGKYDRYALKEKIKTLVQATTIYLALRDSMPPGYGHADGGE